MIDTIWILVIGLANGVFIGWELANWDQRRRAKRQAGAD